MSVILVVTSPVALLAHRDLSDYVAFEDALTSGLLRTLWAAAGVCGAMAILLGLGLYRSQETRVARNEAISGLILGVEGVATAAFLLYFTAGDMETFARNFLSFENVAPEFDAFLNGMKNTVYLSLISTGCGIAVGLFFAMLAVSTRALIRAPARIYINVVRGTPILVLLSLVYFGFALGLRINWEPFTALVVVLTINHSAYMAEIFRAGIQSIERGQLDAARGLGLPYLRSMRLIIMPQAIRRVIPPLMNEFIVVTKDTSLIVFIGVSLNQRELFAVASQGYSTYFNASFYVAVALGYLAITLPLIAVVNRVEKRMRSGLVAIG